MRCTIQLTAAVARLESYDTCRVIVAFTQGDAQPMLSAMVSTLVAVFEAHRTASCLTTLAVAVEFFGDNPDAAPLLAAVLTSVCSSAAPIYKVVSLFRHAQYGCQWQLCCVILRIAHSTICPCHRTDLLGEGPVETLMQDDHVQAAAAVTGIRAIVRPGRRPYPALAKALIGCHPSPTPAGCRRARCRSIRRWSRR